MKKLASKVHNSNMLASCTVVMKLPILKLWLMIFLADVPLWESQMSIYIMVISDLSDTLTTWGLDVIFM